MLTPGRRLVSGSPSRRRFSRKDEGLPGCWAVPFPRAMDKQPRQVRSLLAPTVAEDAGAFRRIDTLGTRDT
ncbi:MAG: hypothetical protein ACI9OJ_000294 [Myxococcota bacterium]|jgi:hypothetical protein